MRNERALPAEERPKNPSPNSTADPAAEQQALEAIRRGLGMSGVEHDDWDFIGSKVLDSLKQAGLMKPDFESIVRGMEPDAYVVRTLDVHYSWPPEEGKRIPRDFARALEIGAAIVAEYGGHLEVRWFCDCPNEGAVGITTCGTRVYIYFEDEEVSQ